MNKIFHQNARLFIEKATDLIKYRADIYIDYNSKYKSSDWDKIKIPEDIYIPHLQYFQELAFEYISNIEDINEYQFLKYSVVNEIIENLAYYFITNYFTNQHDKIYYSEKLPASDKIDFEWNTFDCMPEKHVFVYDKKQKYVFLVLAEELTD